MELVWQKSLVGPQSILQVARHFAEEPGTCLLYSGGSYVTATKSFLFLFPIDSLEIRASAELYPGINPWDHLEKHLKMTNQGVQPEWVGFFSYEMGMFSDAHKTYPYQSAITPDAYFQRSGVILEYDHQLDQLNLYKNNGFSISSVKEALNQNKPICSQNRSSYNLAQELENPKSYFSKVKQAKELILSGDIYQVNLSQQILLRGTGHPFEIFLNMLELNPAPFTAFLKHSDFTIVSTSPERFLKKKGSQLETRPIKGTAPRGKTEAEDRIHKTHLMTSPKEAAELLMITDLMRNDLGKVSSPGTVQTLTLSNLEAYTNVFHKHSHIVSQVLPHLTPLQIIRSCFPGGSITGCPKLSAMQVIQNLENKSRGIYTGSIGYLTDHYDFDFNIAIRTLVFFEDFVDIRLGGGIVADSDPVLEYEETLHKGTSLFKALNLKF